MKKAMLLAIIGALFGAALVGCKGQETITVTDDPNAAAAPPTEQKVEGTDNTSMNSAATTSE